MSYFCRFCGKVLTTGDDVDRCNPICSQKNMPVFETEQISWDTLKYQNDQLRAENERLHSENERLLEGLQKIYDLVNGSNTEYAVQLVITMQDEAQQALNEVTK